MDKVIKPDKIVTDTQMLRVLVEQGIDKDYVEFCEDYTKEHPCAKFYRDLKSNRRFMVASGLPMVNQVGEKIVPRWIKRGRAYFSAPNTFSASVSKGKVRYSFGADLVEWNPQLFLDDIEIKPKSVALLAVDPLNENYRENTLEWDYGICKRRIRIIEDRLRERWFFESNPNGSVRIKHNQTGTPKLKLVGARGSSDVTLLDATITDDEEIVSKDTFDSAEYPVEVGTDLTVYSTANDGQARRDSTTSYADCHDGAGEDAVDDEWLVYLSNRGLATKDLINRVFLYFDTSALPDTCTITAAVLSLRCYSTTENDSGHSDVCLVEGIQSTPLVAGDYQAHVNKTTEGTDNKWEYPLSTAAYTAKSLNATGIGWISKTGTTLFCLRTEGDRANSEPAGDNYANIYANEKGTGYYPRLVVTYTAAAAFIPRVIII